MRALPPDLAAHLAGGVTTLARCWTIERRDGVVLGFTDHDRDLVLDGVPHRAAAALDPSELATEGGLAVGGGEVVGVLDHAVLSEAAIQRGLFDGARVRSILVNWAHPETRLELDCYEIGEIRRGDSRFEAELRSLAHRFDEERGRLYTRRCAADLGDGRCRVEVTSVAGTVADTDGASQVTVEGLQAAAGAYSAGRVLFLDGANAGRGVEIRTHAREGNAHHLALWLPMPQIIRVGDRFEIRPGCDKRFETCRDRFGNAANFQGFPHMPGNDLLLAVAGPDGRTVMDGGSLFR